MRTQQSVAPEPQAARVFAINVVCRSPVNGVVGLKNCRDSRDTQNDTESMKTMYANINIPDEVAGELFRRAPQMDVRAALVERIFKEYFEAHPARKKAELDRINENADALNREAIDVLDYQVIP